MKDLRIIQAQTILKVYSISPIRGFLPLSIVVIGERMNLASQVEYNGVLAPEFVAQSSSRLIVRVPNSQIGKEFQSIQVYSSVNLTTQNSILSMKISNPLQTVDGLERLLQQWLIVFFTTPGSDVFDPNSGGGGRHIVGRSTDRFGKGVAADFALAIDRTKKELLRLQSKTPSIPLAEKLLSSELLSLSFDSNNTTLAANVAITNMLGKTAQATIK